MWGQEIFPGGRHNLFRVWHILTSFRVFFVSFFVSFGLLV